MGGGGCPGLFEPSAQGILFQAVNIFFYIAICGMAGAFEPFPFQDYGKLPLVLWQIGHRLWAPMYRHQLIHKLSPILIRKRDTGSVLKHNGHFTNGAGQQLYPFHMSPIFKRVYIADHFSVLIERA